MTFLQAAVLRGLNSRLEREQDGVSRPLVPVEWVSRQEVRFPGGGPGGENAALLPEPGFAAAALGSWTRLSGGGC